MTCSPSGRVGRNPSVTLPSALFSHPPAFTAVLRGPDNGGCRPEEYEGVGADRWYRKAVVQEEDAEPAEQARHGRKRSLHQRQSLHRP